MIDLLEKAPEYLQVALTVVGTAAAVASITPTPKDDLILGILHKILNVLAFNFGKSKNEKPDG